MKKTIYMLKGDQAFSWYLVAATVFLLLAFSAVTTRPAFASSPYLTDSAGEVVKNSFGECWRTGAWTPETATKECDPDLFEEEPATEPAPKDSDGDGVPDDQDDCPGTPPGVQVDSNGCALDSDGDGVPDYQDRCPNTAAGTEVDENGCPIVGTTLFTIEGVNFAFDSAELRPEAKSTLNEAIRVLRDNRNVNVAIVGHTDSTGPEDYNQGLSERRARSVFDYLSNNGVDTSRMRSYGRGESEPVASNETKAGRAENRRVEFVVEN